MLLPHLMNNKNRICCLVNYKKYRHCTPQTVIRRMKNEHTDLSVGNSFAHETVYAWCEF